ncbi:MAG: nucleotidyltransferase domain-containing protein [bacterium]|nr:nucleotidyltransferase domain-containing protein [bacterium]
MEKYLYLITEKRKKEREDAEVIRQKLLGEVKDLLSDFSKVIPFEEAYVFGSLVKPGSFFVDSDIDIAFYGLKDENFIPAISFLSEHLNRDVDVVQLEGYRLEEKIKKEGIKWTE